MNGLLKHIGLAALLIGVNFASAEELVSWKLDGLSRTPTVATQAAPTKVHAEVKSSDLTLGDALKATTWPDSLAVYSKDLSADLRSAVDYDEYYSFTITPKNDKKISYSSIFNRLTINTGNTETGASIQFVLMSSSTGFAPADELSPLTPIGSFTVVHPANNDKVTTVEKIFDISGVEALQQVASEVEFRIYAVLVDGVGNRMGYGHIFYEDEQDDLRVMGTVE